jgi:DNA-binding response OmpR family regulator
MSGRSINNPASKVLVVCDDQRTGEIWLYLLERAQIKSIQINCIEEVVLTSMSNHLPDVLVIDINSSQICQVLHLCRRIRTYTIIPIILLSPIENEEILLEFYSAGIDEYIPKPVSPALFTAKIRVWQRRAGTMPLDTLDDINIGDLYLLPSRRLVMRSNGSEIKLTKLELQLLYELMSHPGRAMAKDVLIERIWGYCGDGDQVLLKNVIYRLRKKIELNPKQPQIIQISPNGEYVMQLRQNAQDGEIS